MCVWFFFVPWRKFCELSVKFSVKNWKPKTFGSEMLPWCLMWVVVWVPHFLLLFYRLGSLIGLHLLWCTRIFHLADLVRWFMETSWPLCIMADIVQLGSLAHRGEWGHKAPKVKLPWGSMVAFPNQNVPFLAENWKFFSFWLLGLHFFLKFSVKSRYSVQNFVQSKIQFSVQNIALMKNFQPVPVFSLICNIYRCI